MKLHIGCSDVYLKNYINIDANVDYFADEAPEDLLKMNTTTFKKYYKHDFGKSSNRCIADIEATLDDLPFDEHSVDEIILFHILEHLPQYEIKRSLEEVNRVLKVNGKLLIAVPDEKGNAELLAKAKTQKEEEWAIRLIHGTQKNKWSHHYCGYTKKTLKKLLKEYGFGKFKNRKNINFYPVIHLTAFKLKDKYTVIDDEMSFYMPCTF